MGFFNFVCGTFQCIRCNSTISDCIQTKLFLTDALHNNVRFKEGDLVAIDGLCDYVKLWPYKNSSMLNVIIGDWECANCSLSYQWAKVRFSAAGTFDTPSCIKATIGEIRAFVPRSETDFADMNYVEEDLARLSAFPESQKFNRDLFYELTVENRIQQIISGYQRWYSAIVANH